jgi:hypothetical protein
MACAIESAAPAQKANSGKVLTLAELRDLLDFLENQGADKELLDEVVQSHLPAPILTERLTAARP